jgi:hypothetical protein
MLQFEHLSNEVILCVWDKLPSADVIYSFSDLNTRINSLLLEFHGVYKQLDISYCSLSACRFLCRQVPSTIEWRLGLTTLKLGNLYRCYQMDMFAVEVKKLRSCDNIQSIFPQLTSFFVFQSASISEDSRDTLLFAVAGGSSMRDLTWNACSTQIHHSKAFFDWLFRCSFNLISYKLQIEPYEKGFELKYEHTMINAYVSHPSLIYLTINILNLNTLYVLLHYLPQLEHLGNEPTFNIF